MNCPAVPCCAWRGPQQAGLISWVVMSTSSYMQLDTKLSAFQPSFGFCSSTTAVDMSIPVAVSALSVRQCKATMPRHSTRA